MIVPAQLEQHERMKAIRARQSIPPRFEVLRRREEEAARLAAEAVRAEAARALREKIAQDKRDAEDERLKELTRAYRLAFDNKARPKRTVREIQAAVAVASGVPVNDIISHRRTVRFTIPRHFAIWLVRRDTTLSTPSIGRLFGNRDHTTILHACRKIDRLIAAGELPHSLMALVREGK
ncbi:MAG: hypothetical protein JSS66_19065 [Armatimonadetes bacterium]|nr:hypothetical protein [Armatimonadota bacterium]